jgi:hypothetical protein
MLPRHWDGRRLLQFLTGLALIALAFALPALAPPAPPSTPSIAVITTVDAPPAPEAVAAPEDADIVAVTPAEIDIVADSLAAAAAESVPDLSIDEGQGDGGQGGSDVTQRAYGERGPPGR